MASSTLQLLCLVFNYFLSFWNETSLLLFELVCGNYPHSTYVCTCLYLYPVITSFPPFMMLPQQQSWSSPPKTSPNFFPPRHGTLIGILNFFLVSPVGCCHRSLYTILVLGILIIHIFKGSRSEQFPDHHSPPRSRTST